MLGVGKHIFGVGATTIPSGADLNNYTTPGAYRCADSTISVTLLNNPTNSAFMLWCISPYVSGLATYGIQILFNHLGIRVRYKTNASTWSEWKTVQLS